MSTGVDSVFQYEWTSTNGVTRKRGRRGARLLRRLLDEDGPGLVVDHVPVCGRRVEGVEKLQTQKRATARRAASRPCVALPPVNHMALEHKRGVAETAVHAAKKQKK